MKKTLSIFLSVLMLLSVFSVAAFAAGAPELEDLTCTYDGVSLTWSASDDAVNYLVYRADGADAEFVCIATTTETEYLDKSVVELGAYTYKVTVVKADGEYTKPDQVDGESVIYVKPYCAHKEYKWVIDYRATVYASGLKHKECKLCHANIGVEVLPQLTPATPVIKSVAVKPKSVVITWNAVEGATSYNVYRRLVGGSWKVIKVVTSTSYKDTSVVSGKSYQYTVRARNAAGLCDSYKVSDTVKFFSAPTNIAAANATSSIKVTWDAVKGASVYRVYRKLATDESWTYIGNTKTTTFVDKKVTGADNYVYTVRAGDGKAYSSFYAGATLVRLEVPKLTKAVSSAEGITVTINQVDGAKGYDVYRKTANSGWVRIGRVNSTRSSGYLDKSAKKGVTYTYTIKAFNGTSRSYYNTKGITVKDVY